MRNNKKLPKYVEEELSGKDLIKFKKITLTPKQSSLFDLIRLNKIVVATGPPGTSKTFSACYVALKLLSDFKYKKIIITKPTEIVGSSGLGALPGTLEEKISVYKDSFMQVFSDILDGESLKKLNDSLVIEFKPVQFMRGSTFKNCIVIVDEIQSFDIKELMAIVTRLGSDSKFIFTGDINQNDIDKRYVAVNIFKEILDGINDIGIFEFERKDIIRDPILIEITDKYDKMREEGRLTQNKKNS